MKANKRLALASLTALAVTGAASGAVASDVTVEFVVAANAGGLSVGNSASSATLTSQATYSPGSATPISGDMPTVTVTDVRGTPLASWTLGVVAAANFDDGTDDDANDGTNSVAASNAVVFVPVGDLVAGTALTRSAALLAAPLSVLSSTMLLTDCVCDADGSVALGLYNLGGTGYDLASGSVVATLTGTTPTLSFAPDIYINVPANTPVATYGANVTYTVS